MPVTLYRRQRQIIDFVSQYIQRNGYSPTLQEIATAIGVSSLATVHEHIGALERKGILRKYEGSVRGIELTDQLIDTAHAQVQLPVMGYIAAGQPILPHTDPNATFSVSPAMVSGKRRSYVLQVKGDSMIEEGILDGDYVVVEEQPDVHNGDSYDQN